MKLRGWCGSSCGRCGSSCGRRVSILKLCFIAIILLFTASFIYFSLYYTAAKSLGPHVVQSSGPMRVPRPLDYRPIPKFTCPHVVPQKLNSKFESKSLKSDFKTDARILVLAETFYSPVGKQIRNLLDSLKFSFRVQVLGKSLPLLTTATRGRFSIIIFENYYRYLNMDSWNRQLLDKYCTDYGVGLIGFLLSRSDRNFDRATVLGFPLHIRQWQSIGVLEYPISSPITRIAKAGVPLPNMVVDPSWVTFESPHQTYTSLLASHANLNGSSKNSVITLDRGRLDGIERILFGHDLSPWPVLIAMMDGIRYISKGLFTVPLLRLLQIDIDDIFVGPKGHRMLKEDVHALVESQNRLKQLVPGFQYQLGFSGKYYQHGTEQENEGDAQLIAVQDLFSWFPHMWHHEQSHQNSLDKLVTKMLLNRGFSQTHNLRVMWPYAVSPHHSGVYPVHEPLYEAWSKVWGIRITSTEEYPHLRPASNRRGFIHRNIMVLPRQTCGLYTHTVSLDTVVGGAKYLKDLAEGGDIFITMLFNPFMIFMTHSTNYALDRFAPSTFENGIEYAQCWTNLEFRAVSPPQMAQTYFDSYAEERVPLWGNPCLDKRHLKIWSPEKDCSQFPRLIIVGPQKTGSTALHAFLSLHPQLIPSIQSEFNFEEVQFFSNNKNYKKGLDWYMDFFPPSSTNGSVPFYFEKSATYFDNEHSPERVKVLLPDVRIIVLLISPVERAYSWFQHQRAHGDTVALGNSFEDVINANENNASAIGLWKLHQHCITPGYYSKHIERWMEYFSAKQILVVDGEILKSDPVSVLTNLQQFLGLSRNIDFNQHIKFDSRKGFFCPLDLNRNRTRCLGKGKGRDYAPISLKAMRMLQSLYRPHNVALQRLLSRVGYSTPNWLRLDLQSTLA